MEVTDDDDDFFQLHIGAQSSLTIFDPKTIFVAAKILILKDEISIFAFYEDTFEQRYLKMIAH